MLFRYLWRLHPIGMVTMNSVPSPAPFSREAGRGGPREFQASDHGLVFLLTCCHPGATWSLLH